MPMNDCPPTSKPANRKEREERYPPRWWVTSIGPYKERVRAKTKGQAQIKAAAAAAWSLRISKNELFRRYPRITTKLADGELTIRQMRAQGLLPTLREQRRHYQ